MNKQHTHELESQLRASGASEAEAAQLSRLGSQLHQLGQESPHRSRQLKLALARQIEATAAEPRPRSWLISVAAFACIALVAGVIVASLARNSNPGDLAYGIKRGSEQITVALQPTFRDQMMMRRSDEIRILVEKQSNPKLVASTVDSYINDVEKTTPGSYAALEYCTKVLRTARAKAQGSSAEAIDRGLKAAASRGESISS